MASAAENLPDDTMVAASKEVAKNASDKMKMSDDSVFTLLYTIFKKVSVVGAVYLVGYMGWSVAWLITPLVLAVSREYWRNKSDLKRTIAKASATANEKDVILARINDLPAWVYFPDVERCEWINKILCQVWPNANHFARDFVKEVVEPKVASALAEYKLSGFKFDRILLGTIPPRIGGVKVYDKNTSRNEIILDVDLFYASDCDINFQLAGMRAGIKDFQIHGMVRVIMKPLITKIPLIGGLQIFFLNNPDIDFNLVGVADLLDMPGLSDMLRRIIIEQIGAIMVLPNKLPISLNKEVPAIALNMPEPEGVLRIHVVEAKDLMRKDIGVLGKGKSDPYAIITVGAQSFRTPTIDNTVNPKWDYWCEAIIQAELGQYVHFNLFDKDEASDDEVLGRATVEISNIVKNGTMDTWLTLEAAKHGMLHLRFTWLKLSSDAADLQAALNETQMLRLTNMCTAVVSVYLDSAVDLPQVRAQSKPDPFVILSVGKHVEQTKALKRTDAPVWEQGFTFLVANPENDSLQLKIIDQKTDKELGHFTFILGTLLGKERLEVVSQPFQLQRSGPTSKINMSLAMKILKLAKPLDGRGNENAITDESLSQSTVNSVSSSSSSNVKLAEYPPEYKNVVQEEAVVVRPSLLLSSAPPDEGNDHPKLRHRRLSTSSSVGSYGLGRIQITTLYSVQRQRLTVIVHRIANLPLDDPSNIPDPYVKLYLLPGRHKETKRRTIVIKDDCNPVYEATFEYIISSAELNSTELEVTVATHKGILSGTSPVIGMIKLSLDDPEISQLGTTYWYDLLPESKFD